jgi:hypothetical protein
MGGNIDTRAAMYMLVQRKISARMGNLTSSYIKQPSHYEGISKIFQIGAAIYRAVVVAQSISRW